MRQSTGQSFNERRKESDPQVARVFAPSAGGAASPSRLQWTFRTWRCGRPSPAGGSHFLFYFFCIFFGMVRRRRHPEVRIRSFPPNPHSGRVPRTGGWRVELSVRLISWDPDIFHVRWCGFRYGSSNLLLSSLVVRRSFGALAWGLPISLVQQALLRQALPSSGVGGPRTAVSLRLVIIFEALCTICWWLLIQRWTF
jgi:hypothetical protein